MTKLPVWWSILLSWSIGDLILFENSVSLIKSFKNYITVQVFDTVDNKMVNQVLSTCFLFYRLYSIFRRVIYANKGDIFGHWDAEWSHTWSDLKEKPKRSAKGVEFLLKVRATYSHTVH